MSLNSYRRLERGKIADPPLRTLVNCSLALGVPLWAVVEPEWLGEWWDGSREGSRPYKGALAAPPKNGFWARRKPDPGAQPDWFRLRTPEG